MRRGKNVFKADDVWVCEIRPADQADKGLFERLSPAPDKAVIFIKFLRLVLELIYSLFGQIYFRG